MGEKYIPRIGDVIIYDNNSYVVMDMKVYESYHPGECYYSRDYYLLEEKFLNEYLVMRDNDLFPCHVPLYKRVIFRGFESELFDIKKASEISYEIKIFHGFRVKKRGKEKRNWYNRILGARVD